MSLSEYIVMFVLVAIMGAGLPGPGDASLIAAGTLAGEGKLNVWIVLASALVAWMLGSVVGYVIGVHGGRKLLDHPGRIEKSRRKLLAKGDHAFARHNFGASVTMPAFVSGIFRVRFYVFISGALVAGIGWIGMYVGLSYFLGAEIAKHIGSIGAKAVLGVVVIVVIGLVIRAGVSKWRAARQARPAAVPQAGDAGRDGGLGTGRSPGRLCQRADGPAGQSAAFPSASDHATSLPRAPCRPARYSASWLAFVQLVYCRLPEAILSCCDKAK